MKYIILNSHPSLMQQSNKMRKITHLLLPSLLSTLTESNQEQSRASGPGDDLKEKIACKKQYDYIFLLCMKFEIYLGSATAKLHIALAAKRILLE